MAGLAVHLLRRDRGTKKFDFAFIILVSIYKLQFNYITTSTPHQESCISTIDLHSILNMSVISTKRVQPCAARLRNSATTQLFYYINLCPLKAQRLGLIPL